MISLQRRLKRALAWTLFLVFSAHWLAADWVIRSVAENEIATRLEHDGDTLLAFLSLDEAGRLGLGEGHVGLVYDQALSGHYYVVRSDAQTHLSPSAQNQSWAIPPVQPGQRLRYRAQGPGEQPVLALTRGFSRHGHAFSISVAEDLTEIGTEIFALRMGYLGLTIIVLILAVSLQGADVRRALRPVDAIREELRAVARGDRTRLETDAPLEIKPLVDEINRLLELVARRLQQSRTALGNLAHALKTPLAILYRTAADPALAEHAELARQLEEQTVAMHNRIERELKRARLAGNHKSGAGFNPREDIAALIEVLEQAHGPKRLNIRLGAPDRLLRYDRQDMLELIGNLADNACKWAAAKVRIDVVHGAEGLRVTVADDGPGCPEAELAQLTRRGLKLDESVEGHGLGLAIVKDMVAFYGGRLSFRRAPDLGGLEVCAEFPASIP
ncbi:MAG TPA: sensor histidine kinase [Methylococcaceae bacterium]|nr:sensor histidine kinase [Methylococcaceae bacterium]